jgi:hypothetical protein
MISFLFLLKILLAFCDGCKLGLYLYYLAAQIFLGEIFSFLMNAVVRAHSSRIVSNYCHLTLCICVARILHCQGYYLISVLLILATRHVQNAFRECRILCKLLPQFVAGIPRFVWFVVSFWALECHMYIQYMRYDESARMDLFNSIYCFMMKHFRMSRFPRHLMRLLWNIHYIKEYNPDTSAFEDKPQRCKHQHKCSCPKQGHGAIPKKVVKTTRKNLRSVGAKVVKIHRQSKKQRTDNEATVFTEAVATVLTNVECMKLYGKLQNSCSCGLANKPLGGCFLATNPDPTAACDTIRACHEVLRTQNLTGCESTKINLFKSTVDKEGSTDEKFKYNCVVKCEGKDVRVCRRVFALMHGLSVYAWDDMAKLMKECDMGMCLYLYYIFFSLTYTVNIIRATCDFKTCSIYGRLHS